jgi:hypothetical protein
LGTKNESRIRLRPSEMRSWENHDVIGRGKGGVDLGRY